MKLYTNIFFRFFVCSLFTLVSAEASQWRSSLYPSNWSPGMKDSSGRFLHDFSYAGYRNGEASIPNRVPGPTFNVFTNFGADPFGTFDSTPEIQAAINAASAAGGGIVYIPPGYYRIDGELTITSSRVIIRGAGPESTKLRFSSSKKDTAHIGFYGNIKSGQEVLITQDVPNQSTIIRISNGSSFKAGDDISLGWRISDAFIAEHSMNGLWRLERNNWYPIFRRKVISVNTRVTPHLLTIDVPVRYPIKVRDVASVVKESGYLEEVGIENIGISNVTSYKTAWEREGVAAIGLYSVKNGWVRNIKSFSPPEAKTKLFQLQSVGILVKNSKSVTVTNSQLEGPQNRGANGNGYLFEVAGSNEILFRDLIALRGRHNFIQNGAFGTSGCVFLRIESRDSRGYQSVLDPIGAPHFPEYHRTLAIANLVDQSNLMDGWLAYNRGADSSGAGHTSTQSVFWNIRNGKIASYQFGHGYLIGTTNTQVAVTATGMMLPFAQGSEPIDYVEGLGKGGTLTPTSLYENQLTRRMARKVNTAIQSTQPRQAQ
jgi:hypothetical protein